MKWEYKVTYESLSTGQVTKLNEFGQQGWELIAFENGYWVFKRPLPNQLYSGGDAQEHSAVMRSVRPDY